MRIIAGEWRGRPIVAPKGDTTRPTADRTREALFSMLTSRVGSFEGMMVADLFAGSGALGLEALSRRLAALGLTAAALLLGPAAHAQSTDAEVMKIDKAQQKITLRHGEIKNLDMPPMTMVFRAQDPAMLDAVKVGDKVKFDADKVGGQYTVTKLAPAK